MKDIEVSDLKELRKQLLMKRGNEYNVAEGVDEFKGMDEYINISHRKIVGGGEVHVFPITPREILNTSAQCMHCDPTYFNFGIIEICECLDRMKADYDQFIGFDDAEELTFDFMVPYDDGTFCLINYLDKSCFSNHVNPRPHTIQRREYCEKNGFDLLEIHNSDFKRIEGILSDKFGI